MMKCPLGCTRAHHDFLQLSMKLEDFFHNVLNVIRARTHKLFDGLIFNAATFQYDFVGGRVEKERFVFFQN